MFSVCFQVVYVCVVTPSCLTLCDPVDCSPPGSSVHGILRRRILGRVTVSFSGGSSQTRGRTRVSRSAGGFFTAWQPLFKWAAVKRCRSVCGGLLQLLPCLWVQHPAPHICAFSFLFLASLAGSLSVVPPKRSLKISRNPCLPLRSIRDCCCVCGGRCLGASAPGPSVPPASSPPSRRLRCWQACSALLLPRGPALLRVLEVVMAGAAGSRVADRHRQSWAWLPRFLVLGSRAQTPR